MHSVTLLQVAGLAHAARTLCRGRSPSSSSPCLTAAGNETPDVCLAPARACLAGLPTTSHTLKSDSPDLWSCTGRRAGGGSWERDSERRPGSCSGKLSRSYSFNLISKSPGPGRKRWASEQELNENSNPVHWVPVPMEMMRIWETLFWFVEHWVVISIFPLQFPLTIFELNFFVGSHHDIFSHMILVVQERKSCINYLAA